MFFDFVNTIPFGDKLGHFFLFGSLTLLTIITLKFRFFDFELFSIYYGVVFVSAFVIIEEFSQTFITYRTFDFIDLTADFLGIIMASIIANSTKKYFIKKKGIIEKNL
jgi:VanZ family protein